MNLDFSTFSWITTPAIREAVEDIALSLGTNPPPVVLSERLVAKTGFRTIESLQHDRINGNNRLPFQRDSVTGRVTYRLRDLAMAMASQETNANMPTARRETLKRNLAQPSTKATG